MGQTVRFGVSMDAELMAAFDTLIVGSGHANRSEAVRDLVRQALVQSKWDDEVPDATAVLCLVHTESCRELPGRTTLVSGDSTPQAVATLHVELNERDQIEVRILRGPPRQLEQLANQAIAAKGIVHGCLIPVGGSPRTC